MKPIVLVVIIAVTVYAVDKPLNRLGKSDIERILQDIAERGEELPEEGDEVDSDKGDVIEALRALYAHRCKRNTVDQTENKRLIEIDALVEKLWADKEKQANGEAATGASVTEQKEEHSTEQEVKTPRKNVSHPRFENTPEYTHDRRKLERNKFERKNGKKGNRKTVTVVQDEVHPTDADKPIDTRPVIKEAEERKHHKIGNQKKKITKHNENEESDEHPDSTESISEDSTPVKSRKVSVTVEPVTVESHELATDAPEESFTSDSASLAPAADHTPVISEDLPPVASAGPAPVPTEDSTPVGSTDPATVAPADPTTVASAGASDDAADEEMTVSPSKAINLGQARLKRQDTTAESQKKKRTEKLAQRKSTVVSDRLAANAESRVPRKEKSPIEVNNKTSEEDRVNRKHGSPTKKAHYGEKEGEEKNVKPQKKDDERQTDRTVGRRVSVKTTQNVRPHVRVTDKQPPVSSTGDMGNVGSGEVIRAKNPQTNPKSIYYVTADPKNIKTGAKKASAARDSVFNKDQTPVEREVQASASTEKPAA
ncbi:hypothetical protein GHT06_008686 [Daphnia sinensis]|uniref:Uncharacterized protein n=1 Tax=Daphnia sinensis TaxID=1820382 RepID=A0AAD5Q305_9CRUS|nr:hypothetical protein GHT06_008686 [Daphnia sinensis]